MCLNKKALMRYLEISEVELDSIVRSSIGEHTYIEYDYDTGNGFTLLLQERNQEVETLFFRDCSKNKSLSIVRLGRVLSEAAAELNQKISKASKKARKLNKFMEMYKKAVVATTSHQEENMI